MLAAGFSQWVLYFTLYSVAGWVCETIWCSIGARKAVNRGFLAGPWCPIYGFGALLILVFAEPVKSSPALTFLLSMAVTSILEYFTGWLLETLFQTRWWDYSNRRFHLKGRICLRNSILFGLLGIVLIYVFQPAAGLLINIVPKQRILAVLIFMLFTVDLLHTLVTMPKLRERAEKLKALFEE